MPLRKSAIIEKAQNLVLKGLFRQAIKEWQRLLAETPNDGNIFNAMGDLHLKAGEKEKATASYVKSAEAFRAAGFELKSIALFKKALKVDPLRIEINEKLAGVYAERGLIGNAIDDYLKAAKHYLKQGDFRSSLSIYRKISSLDPDNENIQLKIAEMCEKQGFKEEAVEEYRKIMAIYAAKNRTADLDKITKKILALDPDYYKKDKPFLQQYSKADLVSDSEAISQPSLGASVPQEVPPSEPVVRDFMEPEPFPMAEEQTIYADESLVGIDQEDEQNRSPDQDEKSLKSCLTEADVYLKYGLTEKAIRHLDSVLALFPLATEPHVKLKDIYIQQGKIEKAVEECSILAQLYQDRDDQAKKETVLNELMMLDSKKEEKVVPTDSEIPFLPDSPQAEITSDFVPPKEKVLPCDSAPEMASMSDSEAPSHVQAEEGLRGDPFLVETSLPVRLNEKPEIKTEEAEILLKEISSSISGAEDFNLDEDSLDKHFEKRDPLTDKSEKRLESPEEDVPLMADVFSEASPQIPGEKPSLEEELFSVDLDELTLLASEASPDSNDAVPPGRGSFETVPVAPLDNKNELNDGNKQGLPPLISSGVEGEDYVDLHTILSEDLEDSGDETPLEKTIRYFQSESEENNAQEIETQYDLGIAYKEMGMLPEAIKAFEQASKGENRFSDAVAMLVACHCEMGSINHAFDTLRKRFSDPYCEGKARIVLKYELAQLYDLQGDKKGAFLLYDEIFHLDPAFRDVKSKMGASRGSAVSPSFFPSIEAASSPDKEKIKRRNRVSYL